MSPDDHLAMFAQKIGFVIKENPGLVQAVEVPCLLANRVIGKCCIEKSRDVESGKPNEKIGGAAHAVRISVDKEHDGCVYNADRTLIGAQIGGDGKTWSNISIKKGSQKSPEEDESAREVVHRYAKHIVGAVYAARNSDIDSPTSRDPFKIRTTYEARARIRPIQDRIREQNIAIIGMGGTGAYVLDLISKIPVKEIHILDLDNMKPDNLMRAPGAPTTKEIEEIEDAESDLPKVRYYYSKYADFREDVYPHCIRVGDLEAFKAFLLEKRIHFAFVCIDQLTEGDSPRQDIVYRALSDSKIPFIDSGVSITSEDMIRGAVTTSAYDASSSFWKYIPNAKVKGDKFGYGNVQLPEVNALAASLAVVEWRRRTNQYLDSSTPGSFMHKCRLEKPKFMKVDPKSMEICDS